MTEYTTDKAQMIREWLTQEITSGLNQMDDEETDALFPDFHDDGDAWYRSVSFEHDGNTYTATIYIDHTVDIVGTLEVDAKVPGTAGLSRFKSERTGIDGLQGQIDELINYINR